MKPSPSVNKPPSTNAPPKKWAGLHDVIKATGYRGKDLETYLVRLLFCLFAEDTGLFDRKDIFLDYLINHTKVDGSDLHGALTSLFDTLNRARENRPKEPAGTAGRISPCQRSFVQGQPGALLFRRSRKKDAD